VCVTERFFEPGSHRFRCIVPAGERDTALRFEAGVASFGYGVGVSCFGWSRAGASGRRRSHVDPGCERTLHHIVTMLYRYLCIVQPDDEDWTRRASDSERVLYSRSEYTLQKPQLNARYQVFARTAELRRHIYRGAAAAQDQEAARGACTARCSWCRAGQVVATPRRDSRCESHPWRGRRPAALRRPGGAALARE
jgi:hypothetical protein